MLSGQEILQLKLMSYKNKGKTYIRAYRNKWVPAGFYKEIWHAFRPKLNTSLQTLHTIESLKDERTSFKPDGFSFSREQ